MMKTEQELKDALEDIFFDALNDKSNYTSKVDPENDGYWQCKVYELCADELIKRGYGDVSEYKSEIEQLKAKNNVLKDGVVKAFTNGFNEGMKQVEKDIRRAKIDTINTIIKYCETPNHWNELKDCKLWGGKSDDLREFLNGIFKEVIK